MPKARPHSPTRSPQKVSARSCSANDARNPDTATHPRPRGTPIRYARVDKSYRAVGVHNLEQNLAAPRLVDPALSLKPFTDPPACDRYLRRATAETRAAVTTS